MIIDCRGRELYKCDPNKNIECSKSGCKQRSFMHHAECELTTNKEYASSEETFEVEHDYRVEPYIGIDLAKGEDMTATVDIG